MSESTTIIYTQNIGGRLSLLPRLATLIQRAKREAPGPVILLDAGNCCIETAPLCQNTQGRAAVILLDAIGYAAVNVTGYLSPAAYEKLQANYLAVTLVDTKRAYHVDGVFYGVESTAHSDTWLQIPLHTSDVAHLSGNQLGLQTLPAEQIGIAKVTRSDMAVKLTHFETLRLSDDVLPSPTIAGTLDFIRDEAAYFTRQRDNNKNDG